MEKQYNSAISEQELQCFWQEMHIYDTNLSVEKPVFSIDTPPPTVSGSLHIGHVFSYTQTDIAARFKRMSNFSVIYPFGFDDNGLPTERYVEKKLAVRAESMKRSEFIQLCLRETASVEKEFQSLWKRLGFSVDWNLEYSTISEKTQKISQESFVRLYEKGYVYRRYEPAPYCTTCKTSVAQAELEDAQQDTIFYDITFQLEDGSPLTIATTRPEFLPACAVLLFHPADARYAHLANQKAKVPLFNITVPIVADEAVDPEKGSGLVMCCIFGDKQDVAWAKSLGIKYEEKQLLGFNGKFTSKADILTGLTVQQARQKIVELLSEIGLITNKKPLSNTVNIHERCKKNIEYLALAQWFVKILPYKKELLHFADAIQWYPDFMKSRFVHWIESLGWDWCISRQRFFGIPFPAWHCTSCNHIHIAPIEALPLDPQEISYFSACTQCGNSNLIPDSDVMDTWNTSSLTPQIVASGLFPDCSPFDYDQASRLLPMGIRPQAHDIIRTWAFYTIVKAWMHYGDIVPWHEIVVSGHVLSDSKEKLSKSKDNSRLSPENLLTQFSADAIRYWTASARLGHDVAFSENQLRIGGKLITKLWNAFRFVKEHTSASVLTERPLSLGVVNEWLLHEYNVMLTTYKKHMNKYEISLALQELEHFFWQIFCDNYLEVIKDLLFNPDRYEPDFVEATRWTLRYSAYGILQHFAPYLVHVTEKIYQEVYKDSIQEVSIHTTVFLESADFFEHSVTKMRLLLDIIKQVRRLKTEQQLSLKTPIAQLTLYGLVHQKDDMSSLEQFLRGITHAEKIMYEKAGPLQSVLRQEQDLWFADIIMAF